MREKNQETQADIIAEMRMGNPVGPCAYRIGLPDKEEVYESGAKRRIMMIKNVTVQELADRLEAAAKREKAQLGNAAAMREAVVTLLDALYSLGCDEETASIVRMVPDMAESGEKCLDAIRKAKSALSAPARNCDIHADFNDAITTLANKRNWHDGKWDSERYCILASWLLAPTEEEGAGK